MAHRRPETLPGTEELVREIERYGGAARLAIFKRTFRGRVYYELRHEELRVGEVSQTTSWVTPPRKRISIRVREIDAVWEALTLIRASIHEAARKRPGPELPMAPVVPKRPPGPRSAWDPEPVGRSRAEVEKAVRGLR